MSFYRNKARFVKATAETLATRFGGRVPRTMEELTALPGVGRKTANLVLILAFKSEQNICVDTHVHRISNRLGWVQDALPERTEQALYQSIDQRWWPYINLYLVTWGQNVCRPVYPRCGACAIRELCPRIGVHRVGKEEVNAHASNDRVGGVPRGVAVVATGRPRRRRHRSKAPRTEDRDRSEGAARSPAGRSPAGGEAAGEAGPQPPAVQPTPGAGPVIVVETSKGAFEFETYPMTRRRPWRISSR